MLIHHIPFTYFQNNIFTPTQNQNPYLNKDYHKIRQALLGFFVRSFILNKKTRVCA